MGIISLIAVIDENGGLGLDNQLLCHLPADLQHFKMITLSKPIIMGRKTFESIGRPLPGRTNIIISRQQLSIEGVVVFNSLDEAIHQYQDSPEVIIIGGAQLYAQAMQHVERLYITQIHHKFKADVHFPLIDETIWQCQTKEFRQHDTNNEYDMTFYVYERK